MPEEITLEEFIEEQTRQIKKFKKHWAKEMVKHPKDYLAKMWPGDWMEQFHSFCSNQEEE